MKRLTPLLIAVATLAAVVLGFIVPLPAPQSPVSAMNEKLLRAYTGVYQWQDAGFLYLQMWSELSGKDQLVAFDESGQVRTLYQTKADRFFAGPAAAVATPDRA